MGATIPHCFGRQPSSLRPPRGRQPTSHWSAWRLSELGPDVAMYRYLCRADAQGLAGGSASHFGESWGGEVRREIPSFPCPGGDERPGQAPAPAAGPLCQVPPHPTARITLLPVCLRVFSQMAHLFSQNYFRHHRSFQPATRRPTTIACWTDEDPKRYSTPLLLLLLLNADRRRLN